MRGFPWQVSEEDVVTFFDGYKLVEGSIKIERDEENEGRITGWGAALFETEEEAARGLGRLSLPASAEGLVAADFVEKPV